MKEDFKTNPRNQKINEFDFDFAEKLKIKHRGIFQKYKSQNYIN